VSAEIGGDDGAKVGLAPHVLHDLQFECDDVLKIVAFAEICAGVNPL